MIDILVYFVLWPTERNHHPKNHADYLSFLLKGSVPIQKFWLLFLSSGILCVADQCHWLRELALSYYLLSDELLLALSSEKHIHLEHLRIADTLSHHQKNQLGGFGPTLTQGQHRHVFLPYMRSLSPSSARRLLSPTCTLAGQLLKRCWAVLDWTALGLQPLDDRCKSLTAIRVSECEVTCIGFMEFVKMCNHGGYVDPRQQQQHGADLQWDVHAPG